MPAKKTIRKGTTKRFAEGNEWGFPSDRDVKVLAYDDERVIFEWQTEAVTMNGMQPVTRTASITRKEWDNA